MMSRHTEVRSGYLYAEINGTFKLSDAEKLTLQILDACAEHQLTKILIDTHHLEGTVSLMDRWSYGEFVASQIHDYMISGKLPIIHIAYIGDEIIEEKRIAQMVARNRGASIKATKDTDEAFRWLGVENRDHL